MKSLAELTRTVRPLVRSVSKQRSTDLARSAIQARAAKLAHAPVAEMNLSVAASPSGYERQRGRSPRPRTAWRPVVGRAAPADVHQTVSLSVQVLRLVRR